MAIQITIIGLGQIGGSIGLALQEQQELLRRVGHDKDLEAARQAEKLGALDKSNPNLPAAVREAEIVVLSLPVDQVRETLAIIAPELKEGAVVMDTAPVKEVVAAWAGELLPAGRHYVGLTPVLGPTYLHTPDSGLSAAHADLFRGGMMAIVTPPRASSEAIKLAADLTRLLGANPMFADPVEVDSFMAATHILPQLLASALLNATVDQPGWRDSQKVAGRSYAEATSPVAHMGGAETLTSSVAFNRENVLRMMDSTIAALQSLRSDIAENHMEALEERLERARRGRERWWKQRQAGEWSNGEATPATSEPPTASQVFGRLLGLGRKPKKK